MITTSARWKPIFPKALIRFKLTKTSISSRSPTYATSQWTKSEVSIHNIKKKSYRAKASRTHCAFHKTRSVRSSTVRIRFMPTVPANCSRIGVQWPSGTTVQPPRGEVALPKPAVVHPLTIKSKTGIPWEPLRQNMVYA